MRSLPAVLCAAGFACALLAVPVTASAATPVTTGSLISLSGIGGIGVGERVSVIEDV